MRIKDQRAPDDVSKSKLFSHTPLPVASLFTQVAAACNHHAPSDDGYFWMEFKDLSAHFSVR